MGFEARLAGQVGKWNHSCGLNTIAHPIIANLKNGAFEERHKAEPLLSHEHPLHDFITMFGHIHGIEDPSVLQLKKLFTERLTSAVDVEYAVTPALRALLKSILKSERREMMTHMLLPDWNDAVAKYINGESLASFSAHQRELTRQSQDMLETFREAFNKAKSIDPALGDWAFITNRSQSNVETYWIQEAYDHYIDAMCDVNKVLTIELIELLAHQLGFMFFPYQKLETSPRSGEYFYSALQEDCQEQQPWFLSVSFLGDDWSFQCPTEEDAKRHNADMEAHQSVLVPQKSMTITEEDIAHHLRNIWHEMLG